MEQAEASMPSGSRAKKRLPGGDDDDAEGPKRTKKHSTPDIMDTLSPPGSKFTLGFLDNRVSSRFESDDPRLTGKYKQKTLSKSFAEKRSWEQALKEVHAFNWEKWGKIKDKFPLPAGVEPQVPGVIPQEVSDLIKPSMKEMPALAGKGDDA